MTDSLLGLRGLTVAATVGWIFWSLTESMGLHALFALAGFLVTYPVLSRGVREIGPLLTRLAIGVLPVAAVVLLATVGAMLDLVRDPGPRPWIGEAITSALFVRNWWSGSQAAVGSLPTSATAFQQFWALSTLVQLTLVWLAMLAAVVRLARPARWTLLLAGTLASGSLLYAGLTDQDYFDPASRAWMFLLGCLLAAALFAVPRLSTAPVAVGWVGLVSLLASILLAPPGHPSGGLYAVWAVASLLLVILGCRPEARYSVAVALRLPPLRYLGRLGYGWYLWAWPVLAFAPPILGVAEPGLLNKYQVLGFSLLLAAITYHLLQWPFALLDRGRATRWFGYAGLGILQAGALLMCVTLPEGQPLPPPPKKITPDYIAMVTDPSHPGAVSRMPGYTYKGNPEPQLIPGKEDLGKDWVRADGDTCGKPERNPDVVVCTSPVNGTPAKRVVMIGDSHMQQFSTAFRRVARERNWQFNTMLKGSCPFSVRSETRPGYQACLDWNAAAAREIIAMRPDVVITLGSRNVRPGLTEVTPPGFVEQWQALDRAGIRILGVRDSPRYGFDVPDCVRRNSAAAEQCGAPLRSVYAEQPPYLTVPGVPASARFLDMSSLLCAADRCTPTVGNVLMYMDDNHLTRTFTETLYPWLREHLPPLIESPRTRR
ncbi:acyltransferase [Pseudonocardiaceae bacterium YIM PH 21723]|nr:acyltransferase [Pseudonocardiaceae bacterium YIM PH 21723]